MSFQAESWPPAPKEGFDHPAGPNRPIPAATAASGGGHAVTGVVDEFRECEQVLDGGPFEESQPTVLVERTFLWASSTSTPGCGARPEEHAWSFNATPSSRLARPPRPQNRSVRPRRCSDQHRPFAGGPVRPQRLGVSLAGLGNHAVGGLENRLGAAVVLLEGTTVVGESSSGKSRICGWWRPGTSKSTGRRLHGRQPTPSGQVPSENGSAAGWCPGIRQPARSRTIFALLVRHRGRQQASQKTSRSSKSRQC
ncbi:MAG: hypothetical protein Ct9H300mP1_14670 [Planctomycetaceae bacterium]|nr:MAG: hypothetical protein Ct9H300mP1_14670 [Planctomycetaceae bacterium]